jgi:ligand-binding SRPBCC domain-containing protein
MTHVEVVTSTELRAPPESVWARAVSLEGINHELGPWMRMTAPRGAELSPNAAPLGRRWFRSWILLLGVLPFDYDDLCVERIDPGRGFLERSRMLSASVWEHERTLEPLGERATRLTDRVRFAPRLAATARLHRAVIAAIFRHRHRRLESFFGAPGGS